MDDLTLQFDSKKDDTMTTYGTNNTLHIDKSVKEHPRIFDLHGTEFKYTPRDQKVNFDETKLNWTSDIFKAICESLPNHVKQISKIEKSMRGIPHYVTEQEMKHIMEQFNYYYEALACIDFDKRAGHLDVCDDIGCVLMDSLCPLSYFANYTAVSFALGKPVCVYTYPCLAAILSYFKNIFEDAGCSIFEVCISHPKEYFPDFINIGTTVCVFEDSDFESAIEKIFSSAFVHIMSFNAVKHICVQESVYASFLTKLRSKMSSFHTALGDDYKTPAFLNPAIDMPRLLEKIKNDNVEHIAPDVINLSDVTYIPLIIVDNVQWIRNNCHNTRNCPIVSLQAFRTSQEALSIVKTLESSSVSVWSENSSEWRKFVYNVPAKNISVNGLNWSNASINTEFCYRPEKRFIGGYAGVIIVAAVSERPFGFEDPSIYPNIDKKIDVVKFHNVLEKWRTLDVHKKVAFFWRCMENLESNIIKKLIPDEASGQKALDILQQSVVNLRCTRNELHHVSSSVSCSEILEPIGIIAIHDDDSDWLITFKLILSALSHSNLVVLITQNTIFDTLLSPFKDVCKITSEPFNYWRYDGVKLLVFVEEDSVFLNYPKTHNSNHIDPTERILDVYFCNRKLIWTSYGDE